MASLFPWFSFHLVFTEATLYYEFCLRRKCTRGNLMMQFNSVCCFFLGQMNSECETFIFEFFVRQKNEIIDQ